MQDIESFLAGLVPVYYRMMAEHSMMAKSIDEIYGSIINPIVCTQLSLIDGFIKRTLGDIPYNERYYINMYEPDELHVVVWCLEVKENTVNMDCLEIMCDMFILRSAQEGIILEFVIKNAFLTLSSSEPESTSD